MPRIDIHFHVLADTYRSALERVGIASVAGSPFPPWSMDYTRERMAELDIERALLSISAPGVCFAPLAERASLVRDLNDEQAALAAADREHIGMLATLPLPDIDASLAEIDRIYETHDTDGVILLTNYDGVLLSDPRFDPVMAALDERSALALVHPNAPQPGIEGRVLPASLLEFTFDTTRVAADMILRGTLVRHPRLRLVLAHLGGTLPFLSWRLSMIEDRRRDPWSDFSERGQSVGDALRGFYFDTAMSAGPEQLRATVALVGADRLVYGSDTPFGPPTFIERTGRQLAEAGLSQVDQDLIGHETLRGLLKQGHEN